MELIPHAEKVVFDDCGHFMAIDKAEETAESIVNFCHHHCNNTVKHLVVQSID